MPEHQTLITQTKKWLSTVIIEHGICPFAKREFDAGHIHYEVIETANASLQLEALITQCIALDKDAARETSLLILPAGLSNFEDYLDLLDIAAARLKTQGYEGVYQLASFHPDYCFEDTLPDDSSNYTNKSPFPMLHILRESSVEAALKTYPNPERIPERNIKLTRGLGGKTLQDLLAACYK